MFEGINTTEIHINQENTFKLNLIPLLLFRVKIFNLTIKYKSDKI
jgi:hypothetical protein